MGLEGIMLSQISQIENREIQHDFTYMWNLKNKTNKQNKTQRFREEIGGYQRGRGGGWMKGVNSMVIDGN